MDSRQRILKALEWQQKAHGESPWLTRESLQKMSNLSMADLSETLVDLEAEQILQSSGTTGYLRNRFCLATQPGLMGGMGQRKTVPSLPETSSTADNTPEAAEGSPRAFSMMAGLMLANEKERLARVTSLVASDEMRKLPCLAVTNDLDTPLFKRRRSEAMLKLAQSTGFNVRPSGSVSFQTLNQASAAKNSFSSPELVAEREQRSIGAAAITVPSTEMSSEFARATVVERDAGGRILAVNLPRGGIAAPSEIRRVEQTGSMVVLQLGRRVNAKMIMLTAQSAVQLVQALHVNATPRPAAGEMQTVTIRNDKHDFIVDRKARMGRSANGQITVNGATGGKTMVSEVASVQFAGPVLMLHLDRRVNARSITLSRESGALLRKNLSAVVGSMI